MPIPKPTAGQSKDAFLAACMADPVMTADYPETPQRYAVCNAAWTDRTEPPTTTRGGWPASPFAPTEGL